MQSYLCGVVFSTKVEEKNKYVVVSQ